jgi:hypothetical protein
VRSSGRAYTIEATQGGEKTAQPCYQEDQDHDVRARRAREDVDHPEEGGTVTALPLSPSELKRRLPAELRGKVNQALSQPGMGVALFSDGLERMVCTYGVPRAELPSTYPPANYGTLALAGYCPAQPGGGDDA